MPNISYRKLIPEEISLIRTIDRAENIEAAYVMDNGVLSLGASRVLVAGWDKLELANIIERQKVLIVEGGIVWGAFVEEVMVGVASVENKLRGANRSYCKMDILYVSKPQRGKGVAKALLNKCKNAGRQFGAGKLYISATPTQHTVDFYLRQGAVLAAKLDAALFAIEPEDIHMELDT